MAASHNLMLAFVLGIIVTHVSCGGINDKGIGIPMCSADPCEVATCPNQPDAICRRIIVGSTCEAVFSIEGHDLSEGECNLGSGPCGPTPCKPDPCDTASCMLEPMATCRSDTCTGCVPMFYHEGNRLSTQECLIGSGPIPDLCPDGKPPAQCAKDPCQFATCPALPDAKCRANFCGGCNADFYVGTTKIAEYLCVVKEPCPPGVPMAGCISRPGEKCLGQTCRLVPDAECYIDGCGGCNVIWYKGRKRLTDEDCNGCSMMSFPPRDCHPCNQGTCPDHPDARCEEKRCRTCKAVFYGLDRKEIDTCCKNEMCEDGTKKFHCKKNPCDGAECLAIPRAICKPNYCGGCKAEWTDKSGRRKFTEADCAALDYCPADVPLPGCKGDGKCLGKTCPNYPGATCKLDACGSCNVVFFYNGKRLTEEDCNGCPKGDEVYGCGDPCHNAACNGFPFIRCEVRKCGECKPLFYGLDRQQVTCLPDPDAGSCPGGTDPYTCKDDPCKDATCPYLEKHVYCKANRCEGCKPIFYYKESNERVDEMRCVGVEPCPGDIPVAGCMGNPPGAACLGQKCPNYPNADCIIDGCNGCHVVFFDGGRRLTHEDCNGCPADKPEVPCIDPCKHALCPQFPGARCEARRCGLCSAAFFGLDREEIKDCCGKALPEPSKCSGDKVWRRCAPPANCLSSCERQGDKKCTRNCDINNHCICPPGTIERYTGSDECIPPGKCPITLPEPSKCSGDKVWRRCAPSPRCLASCDRKADMRCTRNCDPNNHCICPTGTIERYSGSDECIPPGKCPITLPKPSKCPGDKVWRRCAPSPRCLASCDRKADKRCTRNCDPNNHCICPSGTIEYKGGSNKCVKPLDCPARCRSNCGIVPPCFRHNCPGHPSAVCKSDSCDCSEWYEDAEGNRVDCSVPCTPQNCGIVPPCPIKVCPTNPFLKCRSSNCDCSEWWEDKTGNRLECKIPKCPGDKIYTSCASVCQESCDFTYSGQCSKQCDTLNHCVCPTGQVMLTKNSDICVDISECPARSSCDVPKPIPQGVVAPDKRSINIDEFVYYKCNDGFRMKGGDSRKCINRKGRGRLTGLTPKCFDMRCPKLDEGYGGCVSKCRTNGECGFEKICCSNGCASVCVDKPSPCPGGRPPVQCFANPCEFKTCPRYPEATCKPNYCDGCSVDWYYNEVLLQPNDCDQPDKLCPSLKHAIRLCIDACTKDSDCILAPFEACCFNGCGHRCTRYIP